MKLPLFSQPVGFLILGYCLCLFSLSLYLIGFVAPFWVKVNSVSSVTYIFGLWRYCRKSADSTICAELQKTNDVFRLIQIAGGVGLVVLLILSVTLSAQVLLMKKRNRYIIITAICLSTLSGVMIFQVFLLCVLIFLTLASLGVFDILELIPLGDVPVSEHFHISYYLAVVSMVLCCIATILLVCDYKSEFA
uniref:Uncharacterized protein LOC111117247 n=1 Tax=Crassostrea virginica TaxID=6565 RepID=A0A8B8CA62_CRAVI|nr:uncharacterized protein LOC111117247 [Crassostrea virginica]